MPSVGKLVGTTAVAAGLVVLAACTTTVDDPSPSPGPTTSSANVTPSDREVSLRFAVFGDEKAGAAYDELAKAFTKNRPDITVDVEHAPTSGAALSTLEGEFARENAPDVFLVDHDDLPGLVARGHVQPVDELLEERQVNFGDGYQRDGLEAFSASAALQCMPHDVSPMVVYYNRDLVDLGRLVEEGDEPVTAEDGWTWEQFGMAARQASRGGVNGVHIEPALEYLAPFVWSGGGELVDDTQTPTTLSLADGDSRAALEEVLSLLRDPQVTPTRKELAKQDAVSRFRSGKLAMLLGSRQLTPTLRADDSVNFDVFPLPSLGRYRTVSDMTGYCISSETEHVQAAADFLAFAVGREGASISTTPGYVVPSNLEVAHSPAFTQPGKQPQSSFVFTEGVRRAERTPFVEEWPAVETAVQPLIERMFYAPVIDLDVLLERADTASQRVLAPEQTPTPE